MTVAFTFPGQGSQYIGMGKELAENFTEAREVFQEVDDTLSQQLSHIMWEGEAETLSLTENTQPALMAVSYAVYRVLEKQGDRTLPDFASHLAGHSLGEYTALAVGGSFSLAEAATLLKLRGQAMQRAVPRGEGAMAAILGLELDDVSNICTQIATNEVCDVANDNSPGQVVISGHLQAVERAMGLAGEMGAKRTVPLPVSAPFHCSLMEPAAEEMYQALAALNVNKPSIPLIANVTASLITVPEDIKPLLVQQVTGTVRWRESVLALKEAGVDTLVEVGAGKVLSGLARRIDRDLKTVNLETPSQIDEYLSAL